MNSPIRHSILCLGVVLSVFGSIGTARAGFVGKNVTYSFEAFALGQVRGSATALVADGTTLGPVHLGQMFNAVFTDTSVLFNNMVCCQFNSNGPGTFNGFHISGTDLAISGVTLDVAGTFDPGFDASRISFDANDIFVNMVGLRISPDRHVLLDVQFGTAPEPGSLALLGLGLFALAASRKSI